MTTKIIPGWHNTQLSDSECDFVDIYLGGFRNPIIRESESEQQKTRVWYRRGGSLEMWDRVTEPDL